jgi:hypothetical protein
MKTIKSLDECETTTCLNKATEQVFWPGQEMRFCPSCAQRARNVAQAMGFPLSTRPLPAEGTDATTE